MRFFVQYDTTTGAIGGTVRAKVAPGPMPEGRGQLEFDDVFDLDPNKQRVNLSTLTIEDIPNVVV